MGDVGPLALQAGNILASLKINQTNMDRMMREARIENLMAFIRKQYEQKKAIEAQKKERNQQMAMTGASLLMAPIMPEVMGGLGGLFEGTSNLAMRGIPSFPMI